MLDHDDLGSSTELRRVSLNLGDLDLERGVPVAVWGNLIYDGILFVVTMLQYDVQTSAGPTVTSSPTATAKPTNAPTNWPTDALLMDRLSASPWSWCVVDGGYAEARGTWAGRQCVVSVMTQKDPVS